MNRQERRAWTRRVKNLAWRADRKRRLRKRLGVCIGYVQARETPFMVWIRRREVDTRASIRLRQELGVSYVDLLAELPVPITVEMDW